MASPATSLPLPRHPDLERVGRRRLNPTTPQIRLGLDLDGVLADTVAAYADIAGVDYDRGTCSTHPSDYTMINDGWFEDHDHLRRATRTMHADYLDDLTVLDPEIPEALTHLRESIDHLNIALVTSRMPGPGEDATHLRQRTADWLTRNNIFVDRLIMTSDKISLDLHYLLDDDPRTLVSPKHHPYRGTQDIVPVTVACDWRYNNPSVWSHELIDPQALTPHRVSGLPEFTRQLTEMMTR